MDLAPDEALAATLDRQAREHQTAAERCRQERRTVWLRLHESGYTYARLEELTGYGPTTLFTELRRARQERLAT